MGNQGATRVSTHKNITRNLELTEKMQKATVTENSSQVEKNFGISNAENVRLKNYQTCQSL